MIKKTIKKRKRAKKVKEINPVIKIDEPKDKLADYDKAFLAITKEIKDNPELFAKLQTEIALEFKNEMLNDIGKYGRFVAAGNYNQIANKAAGNFLKKFCGIEK